MIDGSYYKRRISWNQFESPKAAAILQATRDKYHGVTYKTCGTGALSLLTGIHPATVEKRMPKNSEYDYWTDLSMLKFLKSRHFHVATLSKFGVTDLSPQGSEFERMPVKQSHVLLCRLLMCREEASWFVINGGYSYHNLVMTELDPLLFVNKPSQATYLVSHKNWRYTD